MKKLFVLLLINLIVLPACDFVTSRTIHGNGNVVAQARNITSAEKIKVAGNFDVHLVPAAYTGVKVEADDNLMQYIIVREEGGWLVIKPEENTNLKSANSITITVSTNSLEALDVAGSGRITTQGKFTGANKLNMELSGSGIIMMNTNTPEIKTSISGSGDVSIEGETKNLKVEMSGSGTFKGAGLKTENSDVSIAGSGDATVYADVKLKVEIAGSGHVYYKGNAHVQSDIAGSGSVKPAQ